jgi:DNA-binding MarR family transcriptional regulator
MSVVLEQLSSVDVVNQSDLAQRLLNAACAELVRLAQRPSREALDAFVKEARSAFHRQSARVPDTDESRPSYCLGQLGMIVEFAETARVQKVPEEALAALRDSKMRLLIVTTLTEHGRMRVGDLAARLDKYSQNLAVPVKELADAGLLERQQLGRTVFLSATPMGSAAAKSLRRSTEPQSAGSTATATPNPVAEHVDRGTTAIRSMMLALCKRVCEADETRWFDEAKAAADAMASRLFGAVPRSGAATQSGQGFRRHLLLKQLVDSGWHLLRESDYWLFADDPVAYLPGVLYALGDNVRLNVMEYSAWAERMGAASRAPGGTSAQLLGLMAHTRSVPDLTRSAGAFAR